jgi:glycosyltransferase involved in cell wall biosynthesis
MFIIVSSIDGDFVMGAHQYRDPIGAPMLVTGPPCRNGHEPDFEALEQAGSTVLLLLGEKAAKPGSDEADFATEALCTGGVRAALSLHEATVSMAQRLPEGCTRSAWLLRPTLGGVGLYDSLAAQVAEALAGGWRSSYLQPNAGVPLAGEGPEVIQLPSGKASPPVSQCNHEYPVVVVRFLMHCLPGRRGFYVQATTIAFDVTLFQRPQHMSAALAGQNMLVMYVGYNRVVGSIMGTDVDGLFVADGLMAVSGQVTGAIVNIHSTMYDQTAENLDNLKAAGNAIIYEYIDAIDEAITGSTSQALVALRSAATAKADLLVYTATTLREQLGHNRPPSHYAFVPNGVDPSMYEVDERAPVPSAMRAIVGSGKPIVGYFGSIAPWIWLDMVAELAQLVPEAEFVMLGPTYGSARVPDKRHLPQNLHYLGPVAAKKLVLYSRHWSVGIIPFRKGEIAQTTSPLKLFEYFALGLPVVVTDDMHECMQFKDVLGASDARSFAAQVRVAISRATDPSFRDSTRELAKLNSWEIRAVSTLAALQLAMQKADTKVA